MALTLYSHPLASYCWKVLIALYEKGLTFEARTVNLGDPAEKAAFQALWPTAKIPLLADGETIVPETSIIIEHLERYPGKVRLIPSEPRAQLEARLWDRIFDCYIMDPMQRVIAQELRSTQERDALASSNAAAQLSAGYDLIESRIGDRAWAAGEDFSIADCAAVPSLFYATTIRPIPASHTKLSSYFERLVSRPSVRRVIMEAAPHFPFYPLHEAIPVRFRAGSPDGQPPNQRQTGST
jgi:glutathione S-transferase